MAKLLACRGAACLGPYQISCSRNKFYPPFWKKFWINTEQSGFSLG